LLPLSANPVIGHPPGAFLSATPPTGHAFTPRSSTGGTKKDLEKYLEGHGEELKNKLVGVEPLDHPTAGELIKQARKLFEANDRMTPGDPRITRVLRGGTARG
jgi:hypothetical protein